VSPTRFPGVTLSNFTRFGLVYGGVLIVVGMVGTAIQWRRLHISGARPGLVFWLWFAAACLQTLSLVAITLGELEEPSRSPWRPASTGVLTNGSTWALLAVLAGRLFARPAVNP